MIIAIMNLPQGRSFPLATSDTSKEVQEAHERGMAAKEWHEKASMNMGNQAMFSFEKKDRVARNTIGQEDDEAQILVVVGKDKQKE